MLTKTDLMLLLTTLENEGINIKDQFNTLIKSPDISLDVLKFINDKRQLDVTVFYELLRKNYNKKKSDLYKNIVKNSFEKPTEVLTTLAALNLQILLFARKLDDSKMFLKHSRAQEIVEVLGNYYKTYDLIPCLKLLKLIRADLIAYEYIEGKR